MHLNGKTIADTINAAVTAAGKTSAGTAVPMHLSGVEVAKQISVATGKPVAPMHLDGYSITLALNGAIAAMS